MCWQVLATVSGAIFTRYDKSWVYLFFISDASQFQKIFNITDFIKLITRQVKTTNQSNPSNTGQSKPERNSHHKSKIKEDTCKTCSRHMSA